jgi:hypothetical protein
MRWGRTDTLDGQVRAVLGRRSRKAARAGATASVKKGNYISEKFSTKESQTKFIGSALVLIFFVAWQGTAQSWLGIPAHIGSHGDTMEFESKNRESEEKESETGLAASHSQS